MKGLSNTSRLGRFDGLMFGVCSVAEDHSFLFEIRSILKILGKLLLRMKSKILARALRVGEMKVANKTTLSMRC